MAADLHIHIFEGVTEEDLAIFFSNSLGSKWFGFGVNHPWEVTQRIYTKVGKTSSVWVGEVSWLKADLFEDDSYIPNTVSEVADIIGEELPVIDDNLIRRVKDAFELENETGYSLNDTEAVSKFLEEHKGEKAFHISW